MFVGDSTGHLRHEDMIKWLDGVKSESRKGIMPPPHKHEEPVLGASEAIRGTLLMSEDQNRPRLLHVTEPHRSSQKRQFIMGSLIEVS